MPLQINDDGIYNNETFSISCSEALTLGIALANIYDDILIGYEKSNLAVYHALCSGILSCGKNIWNCGECTQSQLRFCMQTTKINSGIYIDSSFRNIKIIPFSRFGFTLSTNEETILSESMDTAKKYTISEQTGTVTDAKTLCNMYCSQYRMIQKNLPADMSVRVNSTNPIIKKFFTSLLHEYKNNFSDEIVFNISSDGTRVSAYCDECGFIFHEKLLLICCEYEFEKGNDVPLPHSFPIIADKIAGNNNRYTYRYDPYSENPDDLSKKMISLEFPFLNDGIALIGKLFEIMKKKSKTISELTKEIPNFSTTMKYVELRKDPEATIKQVTSSKNNVCFNDENGRIIARKSRNGKSLILMAESYNTESAEEFCNNWLLKSDLR